MTEIRLIEKDTDISSLIMKKLDWDVVINGSPYQAVRIKDYIHTIGGHWGDNNIWAYPLGAEPTYENLVEFTGDEPVCWGVSYKPHLYLTSKWDETEVRRTSGCEVTRNGRTFCHAYGIVDALSKIEQFREHPLNLNDRNYYDKAIGRKVWWRSEPAVIEYFCTEQACVILKPDGINKFTIPAEFVNDDMVSYEDDFVKADILDDHIWWFRD